MKVVLFSFLVLCMQAGVLHSTDPRDERSANDDKFEEELEQGYQKLKGEPNADNTKRLLEQLHKMEPEIKQELGLSPERKAELQEAMKDGWLSQFTKQSEHANYNYDLSYDYGGVMHYGATGFVKYSKIRYKFTSDGRLNYSVSRNDKPVMVPRDIKYLQTLGSPFISFYEKLMMNLHYKCLGEKCAK
uniref:Astacin domain-containing protein n=1 Tax=Angiostrongylus cantonensis TaxID=6313 RepID=A0A0K0D573_ANGCA